MNIYLLLGRLFFRQQQDWEQRKNAKIMFWTVVFALGFAFVLVKLIKMMNAIKH